jgi:ubiquinone/menaquinone biosynthesis C-methylase UbiE
MQIMPAFDPDAHTADSLAAWNDAAPRYAKLSASLFGPTAEAFIEFAGLRRGWRVLDVACGPGIASRAAARRAADKGSVVAVDLAPEMLKEAASSANNKDSAPIEYRAMNAEKLDLPDKSFDAVICQLGLMLFAKPDAALAEMRRVAKPGAPVACLVQGRRTSMLFTALVMEAMIQRAPHLRAPAGAPTLYAFGPDKIIEEAFAKAGLTEIVARRLNGAFRFATAEEYWNTITEGAGRTGAMLRSLPPETQKKVKSDVLRRAAKHKDGKSLAIPYEFTMARGFAPIKR